MQRGAHSQATTANARTRAIERFRRLAGAAPTVVARAPGRVNLIGEHTDYSDGFVLPVAVDADLVICARARADDNIRIVSANASFESQFKIGNRPFQRTAQYVGGVAALLSAATGVKAGADLVLSSNVPSGVGLSSSAALEVATARALLRLWQADLPVRDIVTLCRRAELEWAGVQCGVMDQAIVAMAVEGHGLLLDCRTLEATPVPIPENAAILVVDSGADRSLASSAYNDRVRETKQAAELLGVPALRECGLAFGGATAGNAASTCTPRRFREYTRPRLRGFARVARARGAHERVAYIAARRLRRSPRRLSMRSSWPRTRSMVFTARKSPAPGSAAALSYSPMPSERTL